MDREKLAEAVAEWDAVEDLPRPTDWYWEVFLAAARRLLEAEEVWWCGKHKSDGIPRLGQDPDRCWKGEFVKHLDVADCRMVPGLLADPEETG